MHTNHYIHFFNSSIVNKLKDLLLAVGFLFFIFWGSQALYGFQNLEGIQGDLALQQSHNSTIMAIGFSKKSDFFVTTAKDSKVKVWQSDGQLIRTIDVGFWPHHIKVINNDQHIFVAGQLGEVKICNIEGTEWLDLSVDFSKILATIGDADITPNGGVFALGSAKGVKVIDAKGNEVVTLKMPPMKPSTRKVADKTNNQVHRLAMAPSGRVVAATNYFGELAIWETDGKLILHEKLTDAVITSLTFNDQGKLAMSLGLPGGTQIKKTQQELGALLVDLRSNGNIVTMKAPPLKKVVFSKDGKKLIGLTEVQNNKQVFIWDAKGKLMNKFFVKDGFYGANDLAMSPDGELIAISDLEFDPSGIELRSVDGKLVKKISAQFDVINAMVVSNDLNFVATGLHTNKVKLWSLYGKLLGILNTKNIVYSMVLNSNRNTLIVGTSDDIQVWDLKRNIKIQTIQNVGDGALQLDITNEGDFLVAVGVKKDRLLTFSLKNGKYVLKSNIKIPDIKSVSLSPQKNQIIVGLIWGQLKALDLSGRIIWEKTIKPEKPTKKRNPVGTFCSINHNTSGENIVALGESMTAILNTKGEVLELLPVGSRSNTGDVTFMNDNDLILIGRKNNVELLNWKDKTRIATYKGHTAHVNSIAYIPKTALMLSGSRDGQLRLWNLKTGYSASIVSKDKKWVIFDDYGFFDASRDGGEILNFSKGIKTYSAEQFALYFNRPDIIFSKLGITSQDYNEHLLNQYKNRLSKAIIKEKYLSSKIEVPTVTILSSEKKQNQIEVKFNVNEDVSQLAWYQIYLNGSPLFGIKGKKIEGKTQLIKESIELVNGENYIEITAFNDLGGESNRIAIKESHVYKTPSKVYFVGMGVSDYKDNNLDLNYAAKDVQDMAQVLSTKYEGKAIFKKLLFTDEKVTKSILPEIKKFIGEASVHDMVVLFITGHGGYEKKSSAEYYFIVHDTNISSLGKTAISWADLEELLYSTKANKKILFMDTCESGELDSANRLKAIEIAKKNGFNSRARDLYEGLESNDSTKRKYLYFKDRYIYNDLTKGSGASVFSSSDGGELSFESNTLQNGFFTSAVISGLTNEMDTSDTNNDGSVSFNELVDFVSLRVGQQTQGLQNPTVDRGNTRAHIKF